MNSTKKKLFSRRWRNIKTIALALLATGALVWSAIYTFDVDSAEIWSYLWISLGLVGALIVLSLVGAGAMILTRKWRD